MRRMIISRAGQMPSYCVSFINDIPRGGKLFHCCQRSVVICTARNPERAVEAAKKRFARIEGICNWNIHAGRIELELINLPKIRQSTEASEAKHKRAQQ